MRTRFTYGDGTIERARRLRRESTPAEDALWAVLRGSRLDGWKFRRQQRMSVHYPADFVRHAARIVIEVDGDTHAHSQAHDARRTAFLNAQGYRVLRFGNNDVTGNLDGVYETIRAALGPSPRACVPQACPSPPRGEGK